MEKHEENEEYPADAVVPVEHEESYIDALLAQGPPVDFEWGCPACRRAF